MSFLSLSPLFFGFFILFVIFPFNFYFFFLKRYTPSLPVFLFSDWNVIPDLVLVSDEDLDATDVPLVNMLSDSAASLQPMELRPHHYEKVWLRVEQIVDPRFPLPDVQSSHVKNLATLMCALAFDYCDAMIKMTWSEECNCTDTSIQDAIAKQD